MSYRYLALVFAALPAWASSISVSINDVSRGSYVDFLANGNRVNNFAGVILGTFDFGPLLDLFSADPYRHIGPGTFYSTRVSPPVGSGLDRIAWLYDYQFIGVITPTLGAGLQLAMWDILADGGDGTSEGYLRAAPGTPQDVIDAWQHYLSVSAGKSSTYSNLYINHDIEGVYLETLIGPGVTLPPVEPPPGPGEDTGGIPEPSTISMLAVSAAAAGLYKLRK